MRSGHVFICLLALCASQAAHAAQRLLSLPPGPYAVGFRSIDLYDYTRTYRADVNAHGELEHRERARPIQTSIWYPAGSTERPSMLFQDYIVLGAHQDGPVSPAEERQFLADYLLSAQRETGIPASEVSAIATLRVGAVRDAKPAPGRFPVLVYNAGGGQPSWDNYALCEYLAGHGYVVIASPNTWDWDDAKASGPTIQSAEASARDIEFHIGFVRTLSFADPAQIATLGYSWGGQAALMVALRNSAIRAVVSLDGSESNPAPPLEQASHHDVRTLRAPYLIFNSSVDRSVQEAVLRGSEPPTADDLRKAQDRIAHHAVFEGVRHADAYHVIMTGFVHGNFASHWYPWRNPSDWKPGEPTPENDAVGYGAMAEYVRKFLDAYLRHDSSAHAWLQRSPAENGIEEKLMTIAHHAARTYPPPAIDAFARYMHDKGFDALKSLVDSVRQTDPSYGLTEADAALWARRLRQSKHDDEAAAVLHWTSAIHLPAAQVPPHP